MKEPDKRYLVFGYDSYYPGGGMGDMLNSFDTIPEAIECIKKDHLDYHTIYDRVEGIEIDIEIDFEE